MLLFLLIPSGLVLTAVSARAEKARPEVVSLRQPGGEIIEAVRYGDEHGHFLKDAQGFLLTRDSEGRYVRSGRAEESAVMASRASRLSKRKASAGGAKYVYSSAAFPTVGEQHSIVVLVEYQDVRFSIENPGEYYQDYLNGEAFARDGATGSCRRYFLDNSAGLFRPTFDVYGPVQLKHPRSYYGANEGGVDRAVEEMVIEAVDAIDDAVDFSQYDHNNDKYVDSIYLIYAGVGESDSDVADAVWPQSWELELAGYTKKVDGVRINAYGCSNELSGGRPRGIGVFVHEFCHVLGLPDLYNPDNLYDTTTPLEWSLMDEGSYANDSRTPPCLSAFERYSLGWLRPEEILRSGDFLLSPLDESAEAFMMTSEENEDEFFIVECRRQLGWDSYLPSHGMLVWHIDFYQGRWDRNKPNYLTDHPCVRIMRADNDKSRKTYDGDPFPGSTGATEFGTATVPALKNWAGRDLNVQSLYDISEQDGRISFKARVLEERGNPSTSVVDEIASCNDGIRVVGQTIYAPKQPVAVYDVAGRLAGIATAVSPLTLPHGLYLAAGKKILL